MLTGENVLLRPLDEADLGLLVQWRNRPDIWKNFFNKFPISMSSQKVWFQRLNEDNSRMFLIIESLPDKKAIGTIGLDKIDFANQTAEYGNLLIGEREYLGRGLAKEATLLLLRYCFDRLNLNRVYLFVISENSRAVKLYHECGFSNEGCLREAFYDEGRQKNVLVMAMLRREWKERSVTARPSHE